MSFATCILGVALLQGGSQQAATWPTGFRPVRDLESIQELGTGAEYIVSNDHGKLRVEERLAHEARMRKEGVATKIKPKFVVKLDNVTVSWAGFAGTEVNDGSFVNVDEGEFGGGIIWFAKDGSKYIVVSNRQTQILGATSKGVYAVQGLDHMQFWFSKLVRLEHGATGWKTVDVSDLHDVLRPIIQDGDHFVFATSYYVSTLETDGAQHELYHYDFTAYPSSIVKVGNSIWVGTHYHLLRLTKQKKGTYEPEWFEKDGGSPAS